MIGSISKNSYPNDFFVEVAKGNVAGNSMIYKFGRNSDVDTGSDPEDIWDGGGLYTFSSSAVPYYISSSNAADTQPIDVYVLTEDSEGNWNDEIVSVTLAGTTKTQIVPSSGDNPIRAYRMINRGSTDIAGTVYLYEDDTTTTPGIPDTDSKIRAQILNSNNQTLMAIYTVPSGKTAVFTQGYVAMGKSGSNAQASFTWRARVEGEVFAVKGAVEVASQGSSWIYGYRGGPALPSKTDILIRCDFVSADNMEVVGGMDILLIDS